MSRICCSAVVSLILSFLATGARAQWSPQSISLRPGWNAVFLEVAPAPDRSDELFGSIPVESVWMWNQRFRSAQFLVDPEDLLPGDPDWLVYFPPDSPQASATTLNAIQGGRPYLIKLGGARSIAWQVTGLPLQRTPEWVADSFNLVGFTVDESRLPTFDGFFSAEPALSGQDVYRLSAMGEWEKTPSGAILHPGEAFWTFCRGGSRFAGPLTANLRAGGVLDFGRTASSLGVAIRNHSDIARTVRITPLSSAAPPVQGEPVVAGEVPLSYFELNAADPSSIGEWRVVNSSAPLTFELAAGAERQVRLAVRRTDMATPPPDNVFLYQSLLQITDGQGSRVVLPVRAEGLEGAEAALSPLGVRGRRLVNTGAGQPSPAPSHAGLWVGTVTVDQVSQPTQVADRLRLQPASGEFPFRIILHVDNSGVVRLLQQVTFMSKTENDETRIVLVTDDARIPEFDGVFERDGALVGQRISTAVFPFFTVPGEPASTLPQEPGGTFEDGDANSTETLQFLVNLPYDDPMNPFVHQFHPGHDNLDPNFEPWGPEIIDGKESWTIDRLITLTFTPGEPGIPPGTSSPDWRATRVGGVYREEIAGMYRTDWNRPGGAIVTPIVVGGRFELTQVSTVGVLNDGQ